MDYPEQKEVHCESFGEYHNALQKWLARGRWLEQHALCLMTNRLFHIYTSMGIPPQVMHPEGKYTVPMYHTQVHCRLLKGEPEDEEEFRLSAISNLKTLTSVWFGMQEPVAALPDYGSGTRNDACIEERGNVVGFLL